MNIAELQAYGYITFTALLVVILYSYIYHLYRSEKKGEKDYEKYSNMALDDEITDKPVEEIPENERHK